MIFQGRTSGVKHIANLIKEAGGAGFSGPEHGRIVLSVIHHLSDLGFRRCDRLKPDFSCFSSTPEEKKPLEKQVTEFLYAYNKKEEKFTDGQNLPYHNLRKLEINWKSQGPGKESKAQLYSLLTNETITVNLLELSSRDCSPQFLSGWVIVESAQLMPGQKTPEGYYLDHKGPISTREQLLIKEFLGLLSVKNGYQQILDQGLWCR